MNEIRSAPWRRQSKCPPMFLVIQRRWRPSKDAGGQVEASSLFLRPVVSSMRQLPIAITGCDKKATQRGPSAPSVSFRRSGPAKAALRLLHPRRLRSPGLGKTPSPNAPGRFWTESTAVPRKQRPPQENSTSGPPRSILGLPHDQHWSQRQPIRRLDQGQIPPVVPHGSPAAMTVRRSH